MYKIEKPTYVE